MAKNPFVRDIQRDLEEWRQDKNHGVLQLEGARQIGKTTELLKFAYKNYEYVLYVNLASDYLACGNYVECYQVIADLLNTFEKESGNYFHSSKEPVIFRSVYREAMIGMCRERRGSGNKVVELVTNIVKASEKLLVSRDEISNAIAWLTYSGIIGECGCYVDGDIMKYQPARRLYYMDCGIASYIGADTEVEQGTIEGILTETFVFAELYRLYTKRYHKRKLKGVYGQNEIDFMLVDRENNIYGIEVKTKDGAPKSLRVYMDKKLIDRAIVAKRTNGGKDGGFETIPVFAVGCRFPYE